MSPPMRYFASIIACRLSICFQHRPLPLSFPRKSLAGLLFCLSFFRTNAQNTVAADTAQADRWYSEAEKRIEAREYTAALLKLDSAERVYRAVTTAADMRLVWLLNARSNIYFNTGQQTALVKAQEEMLERLLVIRGAADPDVAGVRYNYGNALFQSGQRKAGIEQLERSLAERLKYLGAAHPDVAISHRALGDCLMEEHAFGTAIAHYRAALETLSGPLTDFFKAECAGIHVNLANCAVELDETDEAIRHYETARELYAQVYGSVSMRVGDCESNIGATWRKKGAFDKAIEHHRRALNIRRSVLGEDHPDVASSLANIANSTASLGNPDEAAQLYERALAIQIRYSGPDAADLALLYGNIGSNYRAMGQPERAIQFEKKALALCLKYRGERDPLTATTYSNLANSYFDRQNFAEAQRLQEKALAIQVDIFGKQHSEVANTLNSIANCLAKQGYTEAAIDRLKEALSVFSGISGDEHPQVAMVHHNLGNRAAELGRWQEAAEHHERAAAIWRKMLGPAHSDVALALYCLAIDLQQAGRADSAAVRYRQALECLRCDPDSLANCVDPDQLKDILLDYGGFLFAQYTRNARTGLLDSAAAVLRQVPEIIRFQQEHDYARDGSDRSGLQRRAFFEPAIAVTLRQSASSQDSSLKIRAFEFSERAKSLALLGAFRESSARRIAGVDSATVERERLLRAALAQAEDALTNWPGQETDSGALALNAKIFNHRSALELLKDSLRHYYPEYFRMRYDCSTVSPSVLRDSVLAPGSALLEYFVGDSSIYVFVVSPCAPNGFDVRTLPKDFPLAEWVGLFRRSICGGDCAHPRPGLFFDDYLKYGQLLYQKLLLPLISWLPDTVTIIPDAELALLPFDALLDGPIGDSSDFRELPYWVKHKQVSYAPSATLLQSMVHKKHRAEPLWPYVAFAPFYDKDTFSAALFFPGDSLLRGLRFDRLPGSGREVAAGQKLMGGEVFAGEQATEERFVRLAGNYRIIHLALHGEIGDSLFLAFYELRDSIENEYLFDREIYAIELNADLIVLSACGSGTGRIQEDGMLSLAHAFAYAGAKSIVATLWSIADQSTAELMKYFYKGLYRGLNKDAALRWAKCAFLADEQLQPELLHPYFWSAFIPIGDMHAIK